MGGRNLISVIDLNIVGRRIPVFQRFESVIDHVHRIDWFNIDAQQSIPCVQAFVRLEMRRHIDLEARGARNAEDAMEVEAIINSQVP